MLDEAQHGPPDVSPVWCLLAPLRRTPHDGVYSAAMHSSGQGAHEEGEHGPTHGPAHTNAHETLVFISAAEPSADQHGADLIRAARARRPDLRFVGVAGPKMVAAGCESIFDMTSHAGMLLGAVRIAGRAAPAVVA